MLKSHKNSKILLEINNKIILIIVQKISPILHDIEKRLWKFHNINNIVIFCKITINLKRKLMRNPMKIIF